MQKIGVPVWMTAPLASDACLKLVKCACKSEKGCGVRCGVDAKRQSCHHVLNCANTIKLHCLNLNFCALIFHVALIFVSPNDYV